MSRADYDTLEEYYDYGQQPNAPGWMKRKFNYQPRPPAACVSCHDELTDSQQFGSAERPQCYDCAVHHKPAVTCTSCGVELRTPLECNGPLNATVCASCHLQTPATALAEARNAA